MCTVLLDHAKHVRFLNEQPTILSLAERDAIVQLASDTPALWSSKTTSVQERKEIIRLLIERIMINVEGKTEKVLVEIHWHGGFKSSTNFIRPVRKLEQLSYYHQLLDRAASLRQEGKEFRLIAHTLNQEGWRPPSCQKEFSPEMIGRLLDRGFVVSHKKRRSDDAIRMPNEWTFKELAQKTLIHETTLYSYQKKGMLQARRATDVSHGGIWLITADEQEIKRLQQLKEDSKKRAYHSHVEKIN